MLNEILKDDFARVTNDYDFSEIKGKSFFITGATGLLGSQILLFLDYLNKTKDFGIKLYGLARSKDKVEKVFKDEEIGKRICFVYGDVLALPEIQFEIDYIIHGASITASKEFIRRSVETIDIAVNGTLNMLKLAKNKNVTSFIYLSSMEAFGITDGKKEVKEEDLGYIDITNPRSSYMESKRMCENLCICFSTEYGINIKAIRLAQTLGAGIDYNDTRVAAYFARCVLEGNDIVLKTEGKTKRPIIYTSDAVSAILTVLLYGNDREIYTAANPATFITIRETAEMIIKKIANNTIQLRFELNDLSAEYAPNLNLDLNIDKLSSLNWKPVIGIEDAYRKLIGSMKNENSK